MGGILKSERNPSEKKEDREKKRESMRLFQKIECRGGVRLGLKWVLRTLAAVDIQGSSGVRHLRFNNGRFGCGVLAWQ